MDAEYLERYRRLYENHWWWRAREAFLLDVIGQLRGTAEETSILDVGCGDGLFFGELQRFGRVEGVEPDDRAVSDDGPWASLISRRPFDESFATDRRYTVILMLDVLEHVGDPLPLLRRAVELLEPAGSIVVTVPAHQALWTKHDELNHHVRRYSRADFTQLAERAGARTVRSTYFFHWLAPAKLALRLKEAAIRARPVSPEVPPPWLNAALLGLSMLEQRTLTRLPMPFGSSLLVVLARGKGGA